MRSRSFIICIFCGVIFITPAMGVVIPFYDDFEGYPDSTYPAPSWGQMYPGNYAQVSTEQAYTGSQSFKLSGQSGSSRADVVAISFPDDFSYSVAVMVAPGSPGGEVGISQGGSSPLNSIAFEVDANYLGWNGPDGSYPHLLDECVTGKWYKVDVSISGFLGASPTADITITYDENTVTRTGWSAYNWTQADGDAFQLHTFSRSASTLYFDDVSVTPEPTTLLLLSFGGLLLRRRKSA